MRLVDETQTRCHSPIRTRRQTKDHWRRDVRAQPSKSLRPDASGMLAPRSVHHSARAKRDDTRTPASKRSSRRCSAPALRAKPHTTPAITFAMRASITRSHLQMCAMSALSTFPSRGEAPRRSARRGEPRAKTPRFEDFVRAAEIALIIIARAAHRSVTGAPARASISLLQHAES